MSVGSKDDHDLTVEQIKNPSNPKSGLTWLRHKLGTQAGEIDLMLLRGATVEDMARKLIDMGLDKENRGMDAMKGRVERHIQSLLTPKEDAYNQHGHDLATLLKQDSRGVWKFSTNYESASIRNTFPDGHLPTKQDLDIAYQQLSGPGKSVPIDDVLDQIERNALRASITLRYDWRILTERNIALWSGKKIPPVENM